ncbi:hypothetical protein [Nesterenkonia sp. HG001]|uniref:hypothetical protein n=1 Tax=Nesterenkonia sp. HG001 TaxID=2983207 RepID=UPI002AC4B8AF|nr:hypothetical protein [Nesterenkonia sp. HG001]MDZ5077884.1 hypothetical protein [Nesterenkonia sp. HG001]
MFDQLPVFGEGRSVYPKPSSDKEELASVLITVKAAPQPSEKYGDTVCVAGIRLSDHGPEWVRLYPIPFRSLEEYARFSKYEIIEVPIRPSRDDSRAESFKPDRSRIRRGQRLSKWETRHTFIGPLVGEWTMCSIAKAREAGEVFPSLAAIVPAKVMGMDIEHHPGWTQDQLVKLRRDVGQMDLFGEVAKQHVLDAPRFQAWFKYLCMSSGCNGHRQSLLDWEFVALSRRLPDQDDETAMEQLRRKFLGELCDPDRGPLFFVGNQAKRPQAYGVLGVYRSA